MFELQDYGYENLGFASFVKTANLFLQCGYNNQSVSTLLETLH